MRPIVDTSNLIQNPNEYCPVFDENQWDFCYEILIFGMKLTALNKYSSAMNGFGQVTSIN